MKIKIKPHKVYWLIRSIADDKLRALVWAQWKIKHPRGGKRPHMHKNDSLDAAQANRIEELLSRGYNATEIARTLEHKLGLIKRYILARNKLHKT